MMKKQSHGARLPSIHGIWEGVSTVYCRACGAFLHSSIDRLFPAECNGNPHRAMERLASAVERFMSCSGKAHLVQWKVGLHNGTPIYVTPSESGHMDNPILQLHEQDALHRLVNAIDR